jgi:hypothetical protein
VEAIRPDRVRIDVAGQTVEISERDRDALLRELCLVPGTKPLRERFEAAGASRPVELYHEPLSRLRVVLEAWDRGGVLPDGIARLLVALERAGGGDSASKE